MFTRIVVWECVPGSSVSRRLHSRAAYRRALPIRSGVMRSELQRPSWSRCRKRKIRNVAFRNLRIIPTSKVPLEAIERLGLGGWG